MSLNSNQPTATESYKRKSIKREKPEEQNSLVFYPFYPLKPTTIYTMNCFTNVIGIDTLIEQAEKTMTFSIYTKRNNQTKQTTFIAIEFLRIEETSTISVIFDLLHRPLQTSPIFFIIHCLLLHIFKPEKRCFIWNDDQKQDLYALVSHQYLSRFILESMNIIQLQQPFERWYNKTIPHNKDCFVPTTSTNDFNYWICSYCSYKRMSEAWSLPRALHYTFNEFIYTTDEEFVNIPADIQYSVICCMILTKLSVAIQLNWTLEQLDQCKRMHEHCLRCG
ncbi:unnamed protein product [Rotaria magnacalcarata]|uniref:Uncharacterized protein n=1 Tax=Rotaria magnacalcarata TaxID=392030 RepID=A0A816D820_9BILA|nr:unnamed protein product [Rotaria magnacalcarata]CAF3800100.1 unnamed protein product [Rotaria magnacalcarata]